MVIDRFRRVVAFAALGFASILSAPPVAAAGVVFTKAQVAQGAEYGSQQNSVIASQDRDVGPGLSSSASSASIEAASSYANLASGKVGVRAVGQSGEAMNGRADASFGDQLQFTIAGAQQDEITLIGITLSFHGLVFNQGAGNYKFEIGNANSPLTYPLTKFISSNYSEVIFFAGQIPPGFTMGAVASGTWHQPPPEFNQFLPNGSYVGPAEVNYSNTFYYPLVGASPIINLRMSGIAIAGYNSFADFSNTGSISFVLPETVSYSSASGSFLTAAALEPATAVPEPGTWIMLMLGFGTVGAALRRQRQIASCLQSGFSLSKAETAL